VRGRGRPENRSKSNEGGAKAGGRRAKIARQREAFCQAVEKEGERVQRSGVLKKSGGGFAYQARQGGQGIPGISEEEKGFATRKTIDGEAFEPPSFDGSIAALDGVAGTMIESLPGRRADGEVADQADGIIAEALANVEDAPVGVIFRLVGTIGRGIGDVGQAYARLNGLQTSLRTDPLEALSFSIEAVGRESIAVLA
jgi:hypothetical protein